MACRHDFLAARCYDAVMLEQPTAMHVARIKSSHTDKQGRRREYESRLLRRTYREDGKVRHETLANLTKLPGHVVDAVEAALKGDALTAAQGAPAAVTIARSLPHGHVAAAWAMASKLGFPRLLGPACPQRDLALALVISRVAHPGSKLSTLAWWADTTLGPDLGIEAATTDDVYAAMDWLQARQDAIEAKLARRHLAPAANPQRMALFDLSSSWLEGTHCPLGERGYSRDGKKGKVQIEYGLLTDPEGRPVAVRVLEGSTADPAAFTEIAEVVRNGFGLRKMVMVGDRGMITSARIDALCRNSIRTTGGSPRCARPPSASSWPTTARCSSVSSTSRTSPRSPRRTFPASGWSPAGTRRWPANAPASGKPCWPRPRSSSPRSPPASRPACSPGKPRSAPPSARSSASTRWPSTSTSPSPARA